MLPYGSPAGCPLPSAKFGLKPPCARAQRRNVVPAGSRHVRSRDARRNLHVVHQHLQHALHLAHPQQHFHPRQIAVVAREHHRRLIPRRAVHHRHEVVVPGLDSPKPPTCGSSCLRDVRTEIAGGTNSIPPKLRNIPRASQSSARVAAACERPVRPDVPSRPITRPNIRTGNSASTSRSRRRRSLRSAALRSGNSHGHRRWIRTCGSNSRCRFIRFVAVIRNVASRISSGGLQIPWKSTDRSVNAVAVPQIVKQQARPSAARPSTRSRARSPNSASPHSPAPARSAALRRLLGRTTPAVRRRCGAALARCTYVAPTVDAGACSSAPSVRRQRAVEHQQRRVRDRLLLQFKDGLHE